MKHAIEPLSYGDQITKALQKGAFLTTKSGDKVNSMVIGWGHVGIVWGRPVFIAYVRTSRYTRELLDENPAFTVNVPTQGFSKEAFAICGSQSGRDLNKIQAAGLHLEPPEVINVPGIREYPLTLECQVIYRQEQDPALIPENIRQQYYVRETADHVCYYGEIKAAYIIDRE